MTKLPVFHPDDEQPEDMSDSEWGRLQELPAKALAEVIRRESEDALKKARDAGLEVPHANDR